MTVTTSEALIQRDRAAVTPAIYRYTDIAFARGEGPWLYDFEGRRYLDFAAGIATMNVGHAHPRVVEAIADQARTLIHTASHVGYVAPYVDLIEKLKSIAPGPLRDGKGILLNSGSEAVETAIKLARYVTHRPMVVAFLGSFHGRPIGALSLTASNAAFRRRMSGLLSGVHHIPYPNPYRPVLGHGTPEAERDACLGLLEYTFQTALPPEDVAAIIVEPIAGEGGYIVPPDGFLEGLRDVCDRHDLLLIADEVQTGLGRTGKWFAVEHWGVVPDIICLGKAIGGGLPLAGVLARADLMDAWPPGAHGSTFGGNPVACRAGLASLAIIEEEDLLSHAHQVGEHIQSRFRGAQGDMEAIGDVRGRGLMIGVEVVDGRGQPATEEVQHLIHAISEAGVVMTKCGASTLRICPPLTITRSEADEGIDIILGALART